MPVDSFKGFVIFVTSSTLASQRLRSSALCRQPADTASFSSLKDMKDAPIYRWVDRGAEAGILEKLLVTRRLSTSHPAYIVLENRRLFMLDQGLEYSRHTRNLG